MKRMTCVFAVIVAFALTSTAMATTTTKTAAAKPATSTATTTATTAAPATATTSTPATATTESTAPAKTTTATTAKHTTTTSGKTPPSHIVDINSASKEELMKLPGIGDVTADKIIAGRPYKSKMDLEKKKIVNATTYQHVHTMIIAKQPTTAAKK